MIKKAEDVNLLLYDFFLLQKKNSKLTTSRLPLIKLKVLPLTGPKY